MTHPIISAFRWNQPSGDAAFYFNEIGARQRLEYDRGLGSDPEMVQRPSSAGQPQIGPRVDEEYFEWIDLLLAVHRYQRLTQPRPFVLAELGAGFGRWMVNAICALRQVAPAAPYIVVGVEAESTHFAWLKQHLADNNIPPERCRLFHAPIAGRERTVHFHGGGDPTTWYGQSVLTDEYMRKLRWNWLRQLHANALVNIPLLGRLLPGSRRVSERKAIPLERAIEGIDLIDIIDMDVQGIEAEIIEASVALLNARVMRMHVETHSHEVERRIRATLGREGWTKEADFSFRTTSDTPYGKVWFGGGVQSWVNPRFRD